MKTILLNRSDLQKPYVNNPVEALNMAMFSVSLGDVAMSDLVVFIDGCQPNPGAIRICKVLRDRSGSL